MSVPRGSDTLGGVPPPRGGVFERVISHEMLRAGYVRVLRNGGCAGSDGISVEMFGFGLEFRLARLNQSLRDESYRPRPPAVFEVPKPGKAETRTLRVPCVADRVAQTAAHLVLQELLEPEFEQHSYAYRPGRSVKMALDAVRRFHADGYHWVLDADIRAYFDKVPHTQLLAKLSDHVPERRFLALTRLWLDLSDKPGMGLPQGAPIAPILANLYLDGVDEAMAEAGFRMVRYADDFVILCRSRERAEKASELVGRLLERLGLELHGEKTRIRALDDGYAFLGETIRGTTLARQVAELGEEAIPAGGAPAVRDMREIDGALQRPGSRHILGETRDFGDARDVEKAPPASLDAPWRPNPEPTPSDEEDPPLPVGIEEEAARRRSRHAPFIRPLYIREKGRRLETHQAGYAIMDGGACLAIIAPGTIDRIDLFPGVDIGAEALRQAALQRVPVFLSDGKGATIATVAADDRHRSRLHLSQARHVLDPERALALARRFVGGRIYNQRRLLQRLRSRLSREARILRTDIDRVIDQLDYYRRTAEVAPTIETVNGLRGHEARAASLYWPALSSLVKRGFAEAEFRRTRRPAKSAFNAVLNYTAHLLRRDIETLIAQRGLHPGFGVLHTVDDARAGCVFDLMEEFRAPIAEAVAAMLLSTGELGKRHFETFDSSESGAVHIVDDGPGIIIRGYERHVDKEVELRATGERTSWRGAMDHQMTRYIRHVTDVEDYEPYRMDL